MGRVLPRRRRAPAGGAPCRHRHEPARPLASRRRSRSQAAATLERLRAEPPDEPFRLLRGAGRSAQRAPDRGLRGRAQRLSGHARLAQQLLGHFSARRTLLRPRPRPGYALYGGNPTPGRDNPMRAVVRLEARVIQVRAAAAGETRRLQRAMDGARPAPPRHALGRLRRRLSARRERAPTPSSRPARPSARPSSPAAAARSPAASRWTSSSVDVTDVPDGAVRRGDPRHPDRRRPQHRRGRRRRRHHRLRDPDRPRPPLRAALYRRLTRCDATFVLYGEPRHDLPYRPRQGQRGFHPAHDGLRSLRQRQQRRPGCASDPGGP